MDNAELAKKILQTLEGARFAQWYIFDFDNYITGETGAKSKEEILADIKKLFHLE